MKMEPNKAVYKRCLHKEREGQSLASRTTLLVKINAFGKQIGQCGMNQISR